MPESRKAYLGRIAEIESLIEKVSAEFHSRPPRNFRWIKLGMAVRKAWEVASYVPSDGKRRYIYLGPDGRAAVVVRGDNTKGTEKSPHEAALLNLQSLRNNQTRDNECLTKELLGGLDAHQPRHPMKLPGVLQR